MRLKGAVPERLTKEEVWILRSALESRRASVRARMDRVWHSALALDKRMAASVGAVDAKLTAKMEVLRRRHHRLADLGYTIDVRLSELLRPNPESRALQWRPTAAEPF
jgi:hypothetical protein